MSREPKELKIEPDDLRQIMKGLVQLDDYQIAAVLGLLRALRSDLFGENK